MTLGQEPWSTKPQSDPKHPGELRCSANCHHLRRQPNFPNFYNVFSLLPCFLGGFPLLVTHTTNNTCKPLAVRCRVEVTKSITVHEAHYCPSGGWDFRGHHADNLRELFLLECLSQRTHQIGDGALLIRNWVLGCQTAVCGLASALL